MALLVYEMTKGSSAAGPNTLRNVPWNAAPMELSPTGSSQQSAAFASTTTAITVRAEGAAVRVEVGTNPTAGGTSWKIADGDEADFWVQPGHKLAYKTA